MLEQENMDKLITTFDLDSKLIDHVVWINLDCVETKLVIDNKYKNLIDYNDKDNIKVISKKYYITEHKLIEYVKQLKSHPEHFNAHKILGIGSKFHKIDIVEIFASLYDYYRHNYVIHYQHPELEFKTNSNIVIEVGITGGLVIEINELDNMPVYNKDKDDRQKILEACGYYFIEIKINEYSTQQLINYIDKEINNYQLIYSSKIDPEVLWKELQDTLINKQLFDFIGRSIVSTKKYCVNFDDVMLLVGYGQKIGAVRKLTNNYRINVDYVDLNYDEMKNNKNIDIQQVNKPTHGGHNKRCIFLTKFVAYSFIIECQTVRAKEIKTHVINIYNCYRRLITKTILNITRRTLKFNDVIFNFTIDIENNIWFDGKQIVEFLGCRDETKIYKHVDDKFKNNFSDIKTKGITNIENDSIKLNKKTMNDAIYINESGLYQLLSTYKTNSMTTKNFKSWLYEEVIPEIHKTGGYFKREYKVINYNLIDYYNLTVLYILYVDENYYKFGITDGLEKRLKTHKRELNYKEIVKLWIIDNFTTAKKIENLIKNDVINIGIVTNYNKKTEIIKTSNELSINYFIDNIVQKNINNVNNKFTKKNKFQVNNEINVDNQINMIMIEKQIELEKQKQLTLDKELEIINKKLELESLKIKNH
ncbi:hypothetical protein QLL95_gp0515 [Cotonvirus japonicus]|uniref:Bro-N domain-containing protein n=1 Tax=Cotonvirus japonicus TaxID=2811091 RepID=A0ABM7NTW0_9VIRU|nr:hypothetical protein QLL95_gp0515 [Cotonvirus japonicus]BCS83608.1 hypothetical protein [Cotonvirus japonicus]